jgi:hypothetical protein
MRFEFHQVHDPANVSQRGGLWVAKAHHKGSQSVFFGKDPNYLGVVLIRYPFDNDSFDGIQWLFDKKCKNE